LQVLHHREHLVAVAHPMAVLVIVGHIFILILVNLLFFIVLLQLVSVIRVAEAVVLHVLRRRVSEPERPVRKQIPPEPLVA
jgi:hypothetical protein